MATERGGVRDLHSSGRRRQWPLRRERHPGIIVGVCGHRDCVNSHVLATRNMICGPNVNTDPKFELCDTVCASRTPLRCLDPSNGPNGGGPTSVTIIDGHLRIWGKHLDEIRMARGKMVGVCNGHRCTGEAKPRGGARQQGPAPYIGKGGWLHSDTLLGQVVKIERYAAMTSGGTAKSK